MDLRSPELLQIICEELEERASRLARAARSLREDWLDRGTVSDLVRDAHAIKGSAGLLGFAQVAGAARSVEDAWRQVAGGSALTPAAVEALEDIAGRFLAISAIQQLEDDSQLASAHRRLEQAITGHVEPEESAEFRRPRDAGSLGGLLSSVTESLLGGATRVDTAELYRLINRIAEAGLDADSLADLSGVSIEGSDPGRLIQAWRGQLERLSSGISEIQAQAVALANVSFREATATFPQFIRYLGWRLEKDVRFDVAETDVELDRQIVDLLQEPLRHLLVNAVDHGIEPPMERLAAGKASTGAVTLRAQRVEDRLEISVADDGAGVDWAAVEATAATMGLSDVAELSSVLFQPGFSTRTETTDFSGGGDGLALVRDVVEGLHGGVAIESTPGQGTSVILTLPVSLIFENIVLVSTDNHFWGLPEASLEAAMPLSSAELHLTESGLQFRFESLSIPVISLAQAIGAEDTAEESELLVVSTRLGLVGVTVGELVGGRRVAVKGLGPILEGADHITGAALLGGGEVLVVLDPTYLGAYARRRPTSDVRRPAVLVVDDSAGVRQLLSATLNGAGFEVTVAGGAHDAALAIAEKEFDALVIDFSMPRSNGADLVRALRAAGVTVPIVMVSGVADASEQQAAWEAGVDAYLDKFDFRQGVLLSTLRQLLGMRTESAWSNESLSVFSSRPITEDREMALTPGDVEQKTFSTSLRGYDLDEVDDFLDEVVVSLRQHEEQYQEWMALVAELKGALAAASAASGMTSYDESAVGRALVIAQEAADRVVSDARLEADEILSEARRMADSLEETREKRLRAAEAEMDRLRSLISGLKGKLAQFTESVVAPVAGIEEAFAEAQAAVGEAASASSHGETSKSRARVSPPAR